MQSNAARALVGVGVVAVAVVLLIVLSGGDDDGGGGDDAGGVPTVVVRGGRPVGGIEKLEYDKGEQVRFKVRSDVADEVHVHGYDLMKEVEPGETVAFSFPAKIEGVFEAELEGRGEQIAELRVNP